MLHHIALAFERANDVEHCRHTEPCKKHRTQHVLQAEILGIELEPVGWPIAKKQQQEPVGRSEDRQADNLRKNPDLLPVLLGGMRKVGRRFATWQSPRPTTMRMAPIILG